MVRLEKFSDEVLAIVVSCQGTPDIEDTAKRERQDSKCVLGSKLVIKSRRRERCIDAACHITLLQWDYVYSRLISTPKCLRVVAIGFCAERQ